MKKGGLAGIESGELMVLLRPDELKRIAAEAASAGSRELPPLDQLQQHALAQPAARDPQRQLPAGRRPPRARGCRRAAGGPARGRARSARPRRRSASCESTRMPRSSVSCDELGAEQPAQRGRGAAHRHRARRPAAARAPRRCRPRGGAPSRARRPRAGRSAGRRRPGSPSRSETRPTTPSRRPARQWRSRTSRHRRRSPRSCPRRARAACAWRRRRTGAPPPRPRAPRAPCRPLRSTALCSSSRLGALRIAAVATATICSAPTSRATAAWVATTSAVSAIFSAGIAPPRSRLLPIRVKARWVTSSRSCPLPASATSSRVVLLPMSMQAQIKPWSGERAPGARRPRTPGTDR